MRPVDAMVPPARADVPRPAGDREGDEADGAFAETLRTLLHRSAAAMGGDTSAAMFNRDGLFGGAPAGAGFQTVSGQDGANAGVTPPDPMVDPVTRSIPVASPEVLDLPPVDGARAPVGRVAHEGMAGPLHGPRPHASATTGPSLPGSLPVAGRTLAARVEPGRGGPARPVRSPPPAAAMRRPPVDLLVRLGAGAATLSVRMDGAAPDPDALEPEVAALLARHGLVLDDLRINGRPARGGPQQRG